MGKKIQTPEVTVKCWHRSYKDVIETLKIHGRVLIPFEGSCYIVKSYDCYELHCTCEHAQKWNGESYHQMYSSNIKRLLDKNDNVSVSMKLTTKGVLITYKSLPEKTTFVEWQNTKTFKIAQKIKVVGVGDITKPGVVPVFKVYIGYSEVSEWKNRRRNILATFGENGQLIYDDKPIEFVNQDDVLQAIHDHISK